MDGCLKSRAGAEKSNEARQRVLAQLVFDETDLSSDLQSSICEAAPFLVHDAKSLHLYDQGNFLCITNHGKDLVVLVIMCNCFSF